MCSVVGCESWRRGAQCFILPEDPDKRLQWLQFLFEVNGQSLDESSWTDVRVCSEHFRGDCFLAATPAAGSTQLKSDAVPSLYKLDEPESKQDASQPRFTACERDQLKVCHSPTPGSSGLGKEETSSSTIIQGSPAANEVSESLESGYGKMLQKIENLDIIKEKVALLQMSKRYVVNEQQLLRLFSAKCPLCQSAVRTEKVVRGVFLVLNQQCLNCDYSKQWENLKKNNITAALDCRPAECTEVFLKTLSSETSGGARIFDEGSDETGGSSDVGEVRDSDDNWEPEEQPFVFYSEEEESSCEEISDLATLKHKELCTDCGAFFDGQKPHTCEYKIKPFACNICGKRFVSEQAVLNHNRVHNVNYQPLCKYCLVRCRTKADKIAHEQTHLNQEKPYKCPGCPEMFVTFLGRRTHIKLEHKEQKWLKCPTCGIQFVTPLNLQRHLVVHTGEKPFKCSVCGRGFNQSGHLKSHMRLHTGERPYKCDHCSKSFNHNVSLKSHVQRYHTASGNQPKTKTQRDCVSGELQGNGGADSGVEESRAGIKKSSTGKGKWKRTTGRPVGRPKRNPAGALTEDEKWPDQGRKTKTGKARKQKPKRRLSSSEEEDDLSQSEASLESTDEEEEEEHNKKVRSRQKAEDSDSDPDFNPKETKRRREGINNKSSKSSRGTQRKKFVEDT